MQMLGYDNTVFGIDIGSHSIKLAVVRRRRSRWRLLCGISEPVVGNAGQTLRKMLSDLPVSLRRHKPSVDVALQCAQVMFCKVVLPATLDLQQVDMALNLEMQKHLPSQGAKALFMDYHAIAARESDAGREMFASATWLTVVCSASVMSDCLQPLETAQVRPARVSIDVLALDALALQTRTQRHNDKSLYLYIDAGFSAIRLYAVTAGIPGYTRSYPLAPASLQGNDVSEFLLTMRRALQQYHMSGMLVQPARVLLYGGRYTSPGLDLLIQQYCGSHAHVINPLVDWPLDNVCSHPLRVGPTELAPAIALAMQEPI